MFSGQKPNVGREAEESQIASQNPCLATGKSGKLKDTEQKAKVFCPM
jgi:hypothetical protein